MIGVIVQFLRLFFPSFIYPVLNIERYGEKRFYTYTRIINIEGKRVSKRVCVYTVEETGEESLVSSKQGANVSGIIICKPRHYIPRNTCVSRGVFALPSNRYRRKTEGGVGARFLGAASGGK